VPEQADPTQVNGVDLVVEGLRALGRHRSLAAVMQLTANAARMSVRGAAEAALTIRTGERFSTVAHTSDLPLVVDALQYDGWNR
jgi:hypothetical protein